ncbi:hypothetical protein EPO17_01895 [Patescibacteria group bacterium]|nr:MAG: hypothetical protein EPO17_01895 [Patescibacteria group bacterium]
MRTDHIQTKSKQSGQAMIISVVFFLIIGLIVVVGISETVVRDLKNVQNIVKSRESYAIGEALHEDVVYRFKQSMQVGTEESLTLNGYTASSTISDIVGGKRVITSADRSGYIKRVMSDLFSGAGSSFNYGVQTGEGGLILENSSSVSGNVYSNGPVLGNGNISSNATSPTLVGTATVGSNALRLVPRGNYLYIVNESTLQAVSIANPSAPTVVSTITNPNGGSNPLQKDIAIANDTLFITASNHNNVLAFSLTDPANPAYVSSVAVTGAPRAIVGYGTYVYVSVFSDSAIKVLDVANPASMSVVATVSTNSAPIALAIQGSYLYVASQGGASSKIEIFNLANPALPVLVGAATVTANPLSLAVFGNYAYVGSQGGSKIEIINVTNPVSPSVVGGTASNSSINPQALFSSGSYLYAAVSYGSTNQFQIWNVTNPTAPSLANTININSGVPYALVGGSGGYIYLMMTNSNLTSPLRIYQVTGSGGNQILGDVVSAGPTGSVTLINASSSIYARTISDSLAGGNAYFKNISNTTVLGTSYPNSAEQATSSLPISDEVIAQWETDAEAGGVITTPCPYRITETVTLGPIKINCDLEISNGAEVDLGGIVWVNGNISLTNSSKIEVSPSISGKTPALIADKLTNHSTAGKIEISNSTQFNGYGTNSYVMLVSMNNSAENGGGEVAINVGNSISGKVLVYAPHGEIAIKNSAVLKEATAWRLRLQNSATVIYETGLANLLFTSGPSGGYQIQSWAEVE